MVEYSYPGVQTVAVGENVLFSNGSRSCRKGIVTHNDSSGLFRLKSAGNACKSVFLVRFTANVAIAEGGAVEPISVAITSNGEVLQNAVATVTPAAVGDFFNVTIATFVSVPNCCCDTISIKNTSATTAIDVINANLIISRVA